MTTAATAPKPLSKTALAEMAKWDRELPTWTDERLQNAAAYWRSERRLGAGQKRYMAALEAEISRRRVQA